MRNLVFLQLVDQHWHWIETHLSSSSSSLIKKITLAEGSKITIITWKAIFIVYFLKKYAQNLATCCTDVYNCPQKVCKEKRMWNFDSNDDEPMTMMMMLVMILRLMMMMLMMMTKTKMKMKMKMKTKLTMKMTNLGARDRQPFSSAPL